MNQKRRLNAAFVGLLLLGLMAGCSHLPGKPNPEERSRSLEEVKDFNQLYGQNCSGCHGANGRQGASQPLNDPLYMALVSDEALRQLIAKGVTGTTMPGFAVEAGGFLTNAQIDVLVTGMRSQWAQPAQFNGVDVPPYSLQDAVAKGSGPGDSQRGAAAYNVYCAHCHGDGGRGGEKAGSIVDPNYLGLVSDQSLRTTVITGRADLKKPDWRSNLSRGAGQASGQAMTPQEISDVVSWMASLRPSSEVHASAEVKTASPVGEKR